jgi:hypothetical protein
VKKKKKKLSHDERNRVVRFTTGEPYLEYLPNMLNKEGSVHLPLFRKRRCRPRRNSSSTVAWGRSRNGGTLTSKIMRTWSPLFALKNIDILLLFSGQITL